MGIEDQLANSGFGLSEDSVIPFWLFQTKGTGDAPKREPIESSSASEWPYIVIIERYKSGYTVKVKDESFDPPKTIAKATSLDVYDARTKFAQALAIMRGK